VKTKDIVQLSVALVIFAVAGYLVYLQVGPKSDKTTAAASAPVYEKITAIPEDFNQDALGKLSDPSKARDFYTRPDLKTGLDNSQPFGPLR
jgi:hypothetical protein